MADQKTPSTTTRKKARPAPERQTAAAAPEEHIRVRAYYLSLERDNGSADPWADWLRAERELASDRTSGPARNIRRASPTG
jgi:hypothetical protein